MGQAIKQCCDCGEDFSLKASHANRVHRCFQCREVNSGKSAGDGEKVKPSGWYHSDEYKNMRNEDTLRGQIYDIGQMMAFGEDDENLSTDSETAYWKMIKKLNSGKGCVNLEDDDDAATDTTERLRPMQSDGVCEEDEVPSLYCADEHGGDLVY